MRESRWNGSRFLPVTCFTGLLVGLGAGAWSIVTTPASAEESVGTVLAAESRTDEGHQGSVGVTRLRSDSLDDASSRESALYWRDDLTTVDDAVTRELSLNRPVGLFAADDAVTRELSLNWEVAPFVADDAVTRELSLNWEVAPFVADDAVTREVSLFGVTPPVGFVDASSREFSLTRTPHPVELVDAVTREFVLDYASLQLGLTDAVTREYSLKWNLPLSDLVVMNMATPAQAWTGRAFELRWAVENQGNAVANAPWSHAWSDSVYLSTDQVLSPDDPPVAAFRGADGLAVGDSLVHTAAVVIPDGQAGARYLFVKCDAAGEVPEVDGEGETNNVSSPSAVIEIQQSLYPDLVVDSVAAPPTAVAGATIEVSWVTRNAGLAATDVPLWKDKVYASQDTVVSADDRLLGEFPNATFLPPGEGYAQRNKQFTLPWEMSGEWRILVVADARNQVYEFGKEGNNRGFSSPTAVEFAFQPLPDIEVVAFTAPHDVYAGVPISISWRITNVGQLPIANVNPFNIMMTSPDSTLGGNDSELDHGIRNGIASLAVGDTLTFSRSTTVPAAWTGTHWIYIRMNTTFNAPVEHDYGNNSNTPFAVHVTPRPSSDLQVVELGAAPVSIDAGGTCQVTWRVANLAQISTLTGTWRDRVYLSAQTPTNPPQVDLQHDTLLGEYSRNGQQAVPLGPDSSYVHSMAVAIPSGLSGAKWILVATDATNAENEGTSEGNNVAAAAINVNGVVVDLVIQTLVAADTLRSGQPAAISWRVKNQGQANTVPGLWTDKLFISGDPYLGADDILWGTVTHSGGLPPDSTYTATTTLAVPDGLQGARFLIVQCDADNAVNEGSYESNNTLLKVVDVHLTPSPDLQLTSVTVPTGVHGGQSYSVGWTVRNNGAAATPTSVWRDAFYLSFDPVLDSTDVRLSAISHSGSLAVHQEYAESRLVAFPANRPGAQYLLYRVDIDGDVYEGIGEANNDSSMTVSVGAQEFPNLQVATLDVPPGVLATGASVTWRVHNGGIAVPGAQGTWSDRVYLSTDATLDPSTDALVANAPHTGGLAAGAEYTVTQPLTIPPSLGGAMYLILAVDADARVSESTEADNSSSQAVTVETISADLQVVSIAAPDTAISGQPISASWVVRNAGTSPTPSSLWYDEAYLSRDQVLDSGDHLLGVVTHNGVVVAEGQYTANLANATVPLGYSNEYFVLVKTDKTDRVYEREAEGNNVGVGTAPMVVRIVDPVDLVVSSVTPPDSTSVGGTVSLSWTVTNDSENSFTGTWTDGAYLSADPVWDIGDHLLGTAVVQTRLVGKQSYTKSVQLTGDEYESAISTMVPGVQPGLYYIVVRTDVYNRVFETNDGNNEGATPTGSAVTVRDLVLDTPSSVVLVPNVPQFFRVSLPAGMDLELSASGMPADAAIEVLSRVGGVPDPIDYDWKSELGATGSKRFPAGGDVYIRLSRVSGPPTYQVALTAAGIPMTVTSVSPVDIGDSGRATVVIEGAGYLGGAEVSLDGVDHRDASRVEVINSLTIAAVFELGGLTGGSYGITVRNPNGATSSLAEAVRVGETRLESPEVQISGNYTRRSGTPLVLACVIRNRANVDIPLCSFTVRATEPGCQIRTTFEGTLPMPVDSIWGDRDPMETQTAGEQSGLEFVLRDLRAGESRSGIVNIAGLGNHSEYIAIRATPVSSEDVVGGVVAEMEQWRQFMVDSGYANQDGWAPYFQALMFDPVGFADHCVRVLGALGFVDVTPPRGGVHGDDLHEGDLTAKGGSTHLYPACDPPPAPPGPCDRPCDYNYCVCLGKIPDARRVGGDNGSGLIGCAAAMFVCSIEWRPPSTGCPCGNKSSASDGCFPPPAAPTDPNEKLGPGSGTAELWVREDRDLPYAIYFENTPDAAAWAAKVSIEDDLDASLDWQSLRVTEVVLPDTTLRPGDQGSLPARVTLESGLLMDMTSILNRETGRASWVLEAIDPATGMMPSDPYVGLLAPNDSTHRGEGHISYSVRLKAGVPAGTEIRNRASIVFDFNAPIETNEVVNPVRGPRPDLLVTSLAGGAAAGTVIEGEPATLDARVQNVGEVPATNVTVKFYEGTPDSLGYLIGIAQLAGSVDVTEERPAGITWTPHRVLGPRTIWAVVDPDGDIPEVDETNNRMSIAVTVGPRECALNLDTGVNVVAPMLDPGTTYTADTFASDLSASVLIGADSSGTFQAYVPAEPGTAFPVLGGHGYIALCDTAHVATLQGMTQAAGVQITQGLDMISLPLKPDSVVTARALATHIGASTVVRWDPAMQSFRPFLPAFHQGDGFPIEGGRGYAVVTTRDTTVVFGGRGWRTGDLKRLESAPEDAGVSLTAPTDSLPAKGAAETPILALIGSALGQGREELAPPGRPCYLEVRANRTDLKTRVNVDPATGRFSGAFVDLSGQSGIRAGDVLSLQMRASETETWGDPVEYAVQAEDVARGFARLGKVAVMIPPARTLVELSRPNPSHGESTIRYQLAAQGKVSLKLFSVDGRLVRKLVDGPVKAGYYSAFWDGQSDAGRKVAAGVYFYKFDAPGYSASHKIVVLR